MQRERYEHYAFLKEDDWLTFAQIERLARLFVQLGVGKIRLTGGEPLLQPDTPKLLTTLCDAGLEVLLETSGVHDVAAVD